MPITNGSLVTMKSGKAVGTVMDIVHIDDLLTEAIIMWDGESFPRRTDVRQLREATTDSPKFYKSMN